MTQEINFRQEKKRKTPRKSRVNILLPLEVKNMLVEMALRGDYSLSGFVEGLIAQEYSRQGDSPHI